MPAAASAAETRAARSVTCSAPRVAPTQTTRGSPRDGNAPTPSSVKSNGGSSRTASRSVAAIGSVRSSSISPRNRSVRCGGAGAEGGASSTATNARTRGGTAQRLLLLRLGHRRKRPDLRPVSADAQAFEDALHPTRADRVPHDEQDEPSPTRDLRPTVAYPFGSERPGDLGLDVDVAPPEEPPRPAEPGPVHLAGELDRNAPVPRRGKLSKPRIGKRRVEPPLPQDLKAVPAAREDTERPEEQSTMLRGLPRGAGRCSQSEPSRAGGGEVTPLVGGGDPLAS